MMVSAEPICSQQAEGLSESSRWSKSGEDHRGDESDRGTPKGVPEPSEMHGFCDPFRIGILSVRDRWCRSAQPPATVFQPFGLRKRREFNPPKMSRNYRIFEAQRGGGIGGSAPRINADQANFTRGLIFKSSAMLRKIAPKLCAVGLPLRLSIR